MHNFNEEQLQMIAKAVHKTEEYKKEADKMKYLSNEAQKYLVTFLNNLQVFIIFLIKF